MTTLAAWAIPYALSYSPAFTGTPTAPTAAPGTNTNQIATTAFVTSAVGGGVSNVAAFNTTIPGLTPTVASTGSVTLAGTVGIGGGGTGLTSTPTNGQIDIGNGTGFTRATLTQGTGIAITNAAGSITIANGGVLSVGGATGAVTLGSGLAISGGTLSASGSGGTVTSVSLSGGTTGLTVTGSPITSAGTITLGGTLAAANGGTGVTTSTGTGANVLNNGPTLIAPALGTPVSATLTNATGLPVAGVSGVAASSLIGNAGTVSGVAGAITIGTGLSLSTAGTLSASGSGGTVTSVSLSGGTTGLTVSGSPVTTAGTITLTGTLAAANGGTGVTTSTGSGANVLGTGPTLSSPIIGITSFADYWQPAGSVLSTVATLAFQVVNGGTDANINVGLTPLGTGGIILGPLPDGTATGGNARGNYAVDFQITRTAASQVASGAYSAIIAGNGNTVSSNYGGTGGASNAVSGIYGFSWGNSNTVNGSYSYHFGLQGSAKTRYGWNGHSSGFFSTVGDAQGGDVVLRVATSAATAARLTADGAGANTGNVVNLSNNSVLRLTIDIVGRDTTTGDIGGWKLEALIKRGASAAATSVVGTVTSSVIALDTAWAAMTVPSLTADTTNGGINLSITPVTTNACRWVARVNVVEVA